MHAVAYIRGLSPSDLAQIRECLHREASRRGLEIVSEYVDIGPVGFGRMSGWRRLKRELAARRERALRTTLLVRKLSDLPVPLTGLREIVESATILTVEGGDLDGLARFLALAHEIEREHHRERIRFSIHVARQFKAVGRPRRGAHRQDQ